MSENLNPEQLNPENKIGSIKCKDKIEFLKIVKDDIEHFIKDTANNKDKRVSNISGKLLERFEKLESELNKIKNEEEDIEKIRDSIGLDRLARYLQDIFQIYQILKVKEIINSLEEGDKEILDDAKDITDNLKELGRRTLGEREYHNVDIGDEIDLKTMRTEGDYPYSKEEMERLKEKIGKNKVAYISHVGKPASVKSNVVPTH